MTPLVARFIKDEFGTTAIEYALIGVGISGRHPGRGAVAWL